MIAADSASKRTDMRLTEVYTSQQEVRKKALKSLSDPALEQSLSRTLHELLASVFVRPLEIRVTLPST